MTYISLQSNYKVEFTPSNKYKRRTGKAAKVWVELAPFFKKIKPQIGIQWADYTKMELLIFFSLLD